MKPSILIIVLSVCFRIDSYSQSGFGTSKDCHVNVNGPSWQSKFDNQTRATVRIIVEIAGKNYSCTGTLINQNVSNGEIRQLVITAQHCLKEGGSTFNRNNVRFIFNYQSPDGTNSSVPAAPNPFPNTGTDNSFRYVLDSPVNLISWGPDYALMEIIRPIPPHYNVYYAGWDAGGIPVTSNFVTNYVDIHHPSGDIKKISTSAFVVANNNPVATGCRVVTRIIDGIIRLFGGKSTTELVCNFTEIPFCTVTWRMGSTEPGSSGSALFDKDGQIRGVLSHGLAGCVIRTPDDFTKFKIAYAIPQIRDALNGNGIRSLDGRSLNCYNNLPNLEGNYFPAREYQRENRIYIGSEDRITTSATSPLTIFSGADFAFSARNEIVLGPGFTAQAGATMSLRIGSCNAAARIATDQNYLGDAALEVTEDEDLLKSVLLAAYPNPANQSSTIGCKIAKTGPVKLWISDWSGREVTTLINTKNQKAGEYNMEFDTKELPTGIYIYTLMTNDHYESKRLIIIR